MSLYNGIDPSAIASFGSYTETYGDGDGGNIATLFASFGLLETAADEVVEDLIPKNWFFDFF